MAAHFGHCLFSMILPEALVVKRYIRTVEEISHEARRAGRLSFVS
jgi:hypothetical protein